MQSHLPCFARCLGCQHVRDLECTYTGTAHSSARPRSDPAKHHRCLLLVRTNKLTFIKNHLGLTYNGGPVSPPSAGGNASVSLRARYKSVEAPIDVSIPEARGMVGSTARITQHEVMSRLDGLWQQKRMAMGDVNCNGAFGHLRLSPRLGFP